MLLILTYLRYTYESVKSDEKVTPLEPIIIDFIKLCENIHDIDTFKLLCIAEQANGSIGFNNHSGCHLSCSNTIYNLLSLEERLKVKVDHEWNFVHNSYKGGGIVKKLPNASDIVKDMIKKNKFIEIIELYKLNKK